MSLAAWAALLVSLVGSEGVFVAGSPAPLEKLYSYGGYVSADGHAWVLGYDEERDGITVGLLRRPGLDPWDDFTCLNSLRDVEPTVGLILHDGGLDEDPKFVAAASEDTEPEEEAQP